MQHAGRRTGEVHVCWCAPANGLPGQHALGRQVHNVILPCSTAQHSAAHHLGIGVQPLENPLGGLTKMRTNQQVTSSPCGDCGPLACTPPTPKAARHSVRTFQHHAAH